MAKKKTNNRNKWIFIAVAFVVLFVALYALLPKQTLAPTQTSQTVSPTSDPATADWQTYTDTKNGFSIKYPPSWIKQMDGERIILSPFPQCQSIKNCDRMPDLIFIGKETQNHYDQARQFMKDNNSKFTNISMAGYPAIETKESAGVAEGDQVWIFKNKDIYSIDLVKVGSPDNISDSLYNQILSTFRFD